MPDVFGLANEISIRPCVFANTSIMKCLLTHFPVNTTNDMEIVSKKDSAVQ